MRLIDVDALKESFGDKRLDGDWCICGDETTARDLIDEAKIIDAEPVRHGKWIPVSDRLPEEHVDPEVIYSLGDADIILHNASDLVLITVYDRNIDKTYVSNCMTVDGEWVTYKEDLGFKILAWMLMPEPYHGE